MKKLLALSLIVWATPAFAAHSYLTFKGVIGSISGNDTASYVFPQGIHRNDSVTYIVAIDTTLPAAIDRKGSPRLNNTVALPAGSKGFFDSLATQPKFKQGKGDSSIAYNGIRITSGATYNYSFQTIYSEADTNISVMISVASGPGSILPTVGLMASAIETFTTKVNGANHTATLYSITTLTAISATPPILAIHQNSSRNASVWAEMTMGSAGLFIDNFSSEAADLHILDNMGRTLQTHHLSTQENTVIKALPVGVLHLYLVSNHRVLHKTIVH